MAGTEPVSRSVQLDLGGLLSAALAVFLEFEADFVAFVQALYASSFECGGVNENVFAAGVGLDEAVALVQVEELDGTTNALVDGVLSRGVMCRSLSFSGAAFMDRRASKSGKTVKRMRGGQSGNRVPVRRRPGWGYRRG